MGEPTGQPGDRDGDAGPSPEDPNRFPDDGVPAPLDEAPDGRTPSDPNDPDDEGSGGTG